MIVQLTPNEMAGLEWLARGRCLPKRGRVHEGKFSAKGDVRVHRQGQEDAETGTTPARRAMNVYLVAPGGHCHLAKVHLDGSVAPLCDAPYDEATWKVTLRGGGLCLKCWGLQEQAYTVSAYAERDAWSERGPR